VRYLLPLVHLPPGAPGGRTARSPTPCPSPGSAARWSPPLNFPNWSCGTSRRSVRPRSWMSSSGPA
jgi:hypothetical protein